MENWSESTNLDATTAIDPQNPGYYGTQPQQQAEPMPYDYGDDKALKRRKTTKLLLFAIIFLALSALFIFLIIKNAGWTLKFIQAPQSISTAFKAV